MTRLRPARELDAGAVGAILSGFIDATPWMPRIHTRAEDVAHAAALIARGWVTVAESEGRILAFAASDGEELAALYVDAQAQGQGLGSMLLQELQARRERIELWTFQANAPARTFYRKHGFTELRRTDGSDNDEGLPDIRLVWMKEAA